MIRRTSGGRAKNGMTWTQARGQAWAIIGYLWRPTDPMTPEEVQTVCPRLNPALIERGRAAR